MPSSNPSGWEPTEFRVIVLPKDVGDKFKGTTILRPEQFKDREQFAQMEGTLVAISPLAFTYEKWPEDTGPPRVGQRVMIAKFAGYELDGDDGRKYRVVADKDISAHRD